MNDRYLAILAALVFFSFSIPAAAHPCSRDESPDHKHCVSEDSQTTYTVEMKAGDVSGVVATGTCAGFTTSSKRSVRFPTGLGCGLVNVDGMELELFAIEAKFTKKGTSAIVFFISTCCAPDNALYNTGGLPGAVEPDGTSFRIKVDEDEAFLTKVHEPDKGLTLTDPVAIGHIVYTAD